MDLEELQRTVDEAIASFGGYWNSFELLARMTEELGEIARDLQRERGMRPRPQAFDLQEEVGDLLFTLAAFANVNQIDLGLAMEQVLEKYRTRDLPDWQRSMRSEKGDTEQSS